MVTHLQVDRLSSKRDSHVYRIAGGETGVEPVRERQGGTVGDRELYCDDCWQPGHHQRCRHAAKWI